MLLGAIGSIAGAQTSTTRPTSIPTTTASNSKFLRFVPDGDGGTLQASIVTYRNAAGQSVDLISAIHIADASFFHDLNKRFEGYDSLLYEMVKPADSDMSGFAGPTTQPRQPAPRGSAFRRMGWIGMLQTFMKDSLALSFQLEEVDYTKKNFVHADLDVETFFQKQDERGESMLTLMLQQMLREMSREDGGAAPVIGPMDLITALQSPDRTRSLKLVLGRQFGQIDELAAGFEGPNGSVIVTERNKAALKVLSQRLAAGEKKLGIFYGAAHLNGMEKILTQEMGFKQVGEPQWITAWDMSPKPTTRPVQR